MSVSKYHEAVGSCPICGKQAWLNNIPLTAYCWGTEEKPHEEVHRIVPLSVQPYGPVKAKTEWRHSSNNKKVKA